MLPVLDNDLMREADRHTIEDLGVPGMVLMENAATGLVDSLRETFPEARSVLILCGPGNNGGDGFAAARHLHCGGHFVRVLLFASADKLSPDARTNFDIALKFGVQVVSEADVDALQDALADRPDLIVDALLGTGLDRPLGGRFARIVELINADRAPVVAVDVPTGLNGALCALPGLAVEADLTVTFAALKVCHALPPACEACGEVAIVDIGIPPGVLQRGCALHWIEDDDVSLLLPDRPNVGHKGTFGHLLVVAGGLGRAGAVAMAGRAAVATGAGLVTLAVPESAVSAVDGACLEAMTQALPSTADGTVAGPQGLEQLLPRMTALAIGPGMGTDPGAASTLDWVLDNWAGPLLLDADALNLLAGHLHRLSGREQPTVLTPHPGELARLLGRSTVDVVADRVGAAREAARLSGALVVAKGYRTIIADSDGAALINPTGDAHLASGGSGDVLTGTIASFLAQGLDGERSAILGCWLHGRAGELGADRWPAAVPAAELPQLLAKAWTELL